MNKQCTLCFVRVWGPEGINYKQGRQGFHQNKHAEDICRVGQCHMIYISKGKEMGLSVLSIAVGWVVLVVFAGDRKVDNDGDETPLFFCLFFVVLAMLI